MAPEVRDHDPFATTVLSGCGWLAGKSVQQIVGEPVDSSPIRELMIPGGVGGATRPGTDPLHDPTRDETIAGITESARERRGPARGPARLFEELRYVCARGCTPLGVRLRRSSVHGD